MNAEWIKGACRGCGAGVSVQRKDIRVKFSCLRCGVPDCLAPMAEPEQFAEYLGDVATDFRPLLKVLAKISAERCQTSEQQRAVFERALLEYELDPSEYDWVMTADALSVLVGYADAIEGRDWTPGREDLAPLFDFDSLK